MRQHQKWEVNINHIVLTSALVKLQVGISKHLCPASKCLPCRVLRWARRVTKPNPAISIGRGAAGVGRKTGLRWLHLPRISRNTQERS